jgi:hypothetical protein
MSFSRWSPLLLPLALAGCFIDRLVDQTPEPPVIPVGHFVSATGAPLPEGGTGRIDTPWDLVTALQGAAGAIQPGDTVWLRGGTYTGKFVVSVSGTPGGRVTFRAYPGERVTLDDPTLAPDNDDQFLVNGSWLVFWGIEFTNSNPGRLEAGTSLDYRPTNVVNNGDHNRYVNLVIHDGGVGFYNYANRFDVELAGSVIYNIGWQADDRGHGHGVYVRSDVGPVVVRDNVIFNQFGVGIHAYTDSGPEGLRGITLEGNVAFNNGSIAREASENILLGGRGAAAREDTLRANMTYFSPGLAEIVAIGITNIKVGYGATVGEDVWVGGNYASGGNPALDVRDWKTATVTGNVIQGTAGAVRLLDLTLLGYAWGGNTHYRDPAAPAWNYDSIPLPFSAWRAVTGLGATDQATTDLPSNPRVFVRRNPYEPKRGMIVVYNWGQSGSVPVDLSGVLASGDRYVIRSVQDLFGAPVTSGTYGGGTVSVPMGGVTPVRPIGGAQRNAPTTGPGFDVFVVTRS